MAFSLNSSGGLGRGRFRRGNDSLAEINIVPLVDVVLVLLIIFMLTAHLIARPQGTDRLLSRHNAMMYGDSDAATAMELPSGPSSGACTGVWFQGLE